MSMLTIDQKAVSQLFFVERRRGPPMEEKPFMDDVAAPVFPVTIDPLAFSFPVYRDPVVDDLDRDAYQAIRRTDVTAFPIQKLAFRIAALELKAVGKDGETDRVDAVQHVIDSIPDLGLVIRDLVWAIVEGVRFAWMRGKVEDGWMIPVLSTRRKQKAGGRIQWDGTRVIKSREFPRATTQNIKLEDYPAQQLPRDRFVVYRPSTNDDPQGNTDLAWMLYSIAVSAQLNDKNQARYAERFGIPREIVKKQLEGARATAIPTILAKAADKLQAANRKVSAMSLRDMLEIMEPSGTTSRFLETYRVSLESRVHKLLLHNILTADTQSSGPAGSTAVHKAEEDIVIWYVAGTLAQAFTQDLLPFIELHNQLNIPKGGRVRLEFQPPPEQVKVTPSEAISLLTSGQPLDANWWYGLLGSPKPEGVGNVVGDLPQITTTGAPGEDGLPPVKPEPTDAPKDVEDLALNGAQVTALQGIVVAVANGELPAEAALELIISGFPQIPRETAERMVKSAQAFEAKEPEGADGIQV